MKVLVDMNLTPQWVDLLAAAGIQAVHWANTGAAAALDREIMAFAKANGYIVLTRDLDFGTLLAESGDAQPGVVQIRSPHAGPESMGALVLQSLRQMDTELSDGALVTIDPKRTRLRLLPFPKSV